MSLNRDELLAFAERNAEIGEQDSVLHNDCNIIEFLLDNCEITIPESNRFFVDVNCEGIQTDIYKKRMAKYTKIIADSGFKDGNELLAYTGEADFGHTCAEWESVIKLGIFGLRERILNYKEMYSVDEKKQSFYQEILRVYDAALRFIKRTASVAQACGKTEMATGLENLSKGSPSNLFEAMLTSILYYSLQSRFEGTYLRTLGRLDSLFYPFYVKEEKECSEGLLLDYIREIESWKVTTNIPFAIGGSDIDGSSAVNELSYELLKAYRAVKPAHIKLHLLCSDNTPDEIIRLAFEAIRNGYNSIVFVSDKKIIEALEKLGEKHADAVNYHVVGCYECGGSNEITCSCNARVNLPKALELTLNNGRDMLTEKAIGIETGSTFKDYDEFYSALKKQLTFLCNQAIKETNMFEANYGKIHSSPFFSGTYKSALENGGDIYCDYAAEYNNSSLNAVGIATLTDSLYTVKKMVFEDKLIALDKLVRILKSNWENEELLRLSVKNNLPKYGMGNSEVDAIACDVVKVLSSVVNNTPNVKGGVYRLGLFSIDWRWSFGRKTAASADGRYNEETLSQNMSATFGADKNGAVGHFLSAGAIDASNVVNGAIVDIDLHSSSVCGENGINALVSSLKTYFELGGACVHYNVLDTEILKDAKKNPEKYPNLQVRLCGWNVLFSSLSDKEKEEFIARSVR